MTRLALDLPDELLDAVAERVAEILSERREDSSPWLTVDQAAAYTGIPKNTLYKLTAAGAVPHSKPGNRLLFNRNDLDGWLYSHREGPAAVGTRLQALNGGSS